KTSPYRIQGGIRYVLNTYAANGHSYVPLEELTEEVSKLLEIEGDLIADSLRDLAIKGIVHILTVGEELRIYYTPYHVAENNVARKIVELARAELKSLNIDVDEMIKSIEEEENIQFAKRQIEAIKESIENGMVVI